MNIQAACHTAQDKTRMHAHTETERGAQVSEPRHESETQDMSAGIRTPRSKMKQGSERAHGSSTLEAARSHENPDMTGVSGLCHKTMNNTRPK